MKNILKLTIFAVGMLVALPSCDINDELLKRSDPEIYNKLEQDRNKQDKDDETRGEVGLEDETGASVD